MKKKAKNILFIVQFPKNISPGQRFRFELYEDLLQANDFSVTTQSFLDRKGYHLIFIKGSLLQKIVAVVAGYFRRIKLLFSVKKYDFILMQREMCPYGPPVFEWILIKILKKKVIYDFDDAIWIPLRWKNDRLALLLKNFSKVKKLCKWSYKVSGGNEYLCDYGRKYNSRVIYNPTCVDTLLMHNILANHDSDKITIGWTGSFSTLNYLDLVVPMLSQLSQHYNFEFKVICNQRPSFEMPNMVYVEWSEENEVKELASCHIGLMPLENDEWTKGKCGFKLIQYMALEIPSIASPVGVNQSIIDHDINGFICNNNNEWYEALEKLITDKELRKRMGKAGRKKITDHYSLQSNAENFLSLFS